MPLPNCHYRLIQPDNYTPFLPGLIDKLPLLRGNHVTYQKEIHRDSRFAICHYKINDKDGNLTLTYDAQKSKTATTEKKTQTPPDLLNCEIVRGILTQFLTDIDDKNLNRVEVKLIQTDVFPFSFNPHRDSQFKRLKRIRYLATVLLSASGIDGGNMQLFHSETDQLGPFKLIEELPCDPGTGYIVYEPPHKVFHGMKTATATAASAQRSALLLRFFNYEQHERNKHKKKDTL